MLELKVTNQMLYITHFEAKVLRRSCRLRDLQERKFHRAERRTTITIIRSFKLFQRGELYNNKMNS